MGLNMAFRAALPLLPVLVIFGVLVPLRQGGTFLTTPFLLGYALLGPALAGPAVARGSQPWPVVAMVLGTVLLTVTAGLATLRFLRGYPVTLAAQGPLLLALALLAAALTTLAALVVVRLRARGHDGLAWLRWALLALVLAYAAWLWRGDPLARLW